jgi:hypothetical protein
VEFLPDGGQDLICFSDCSRQFAKDLRSRSSEDQWRIERTVRKFATLVAEGGSAPTHIIPEGLHPKLGEYESTLFATSDASIRIILAIDEDPLWLVDDFRMDADRPLG